MEYKILHWEDAYWLTLKVNQYISDWWKPTWGISVYMDSIDRRKWLFQAIIKEQKS